MASCPSVTLRWIGFGLGLGSMAAGSACAVSQRPSVKTIDPILLEQGRELARGRHKGGFSVGPYAIHDIGMRREAPDPDGPLASEEVGRPVSQHRAGLVLDAPSGRRWTTSCTLARRPGLATDYRAVLDENGDEIALDCIVKALGLPPWRFTIRTLISHNFIGAFGQEGSEQAGTIEVLTRVTHFERLERLLPVPVVQLRQDERAVVAVLLGRPERAWVARGVDAVTTEAAIALMLTLRFLPWELAE